MQLVLGLKGLPGAEMGLVRTILRLSSSLRASWAVAEGGACDVLLLGDAADGVDPPSGTTVIPVLKRGEADRARALSRPIRAEELIGLLNSESDRREALAPVAAAGGPASPSPDRQQARLHRWPPFALLNGRPTHVRLATLLSKHPLSAARLSALAARPLAECEAFMRELDANRLLVWQPAAAPAPAAPAAARGKAHAPARRGLFSTLRRKLGIARGA